MIKFLVCLVKLTSNTVYLLFTYMARDVTNLMRTNPFRGPLEGVGTEIKTFWALEW
jgi:hypothetical protein